MTTRWLRRFGRSFRFNDSVDRVRAGVVVLGVDVAAKIGDDGSAHWADLGFAWALAVLTAAAVAALAVRSSAAVSAAAMPASTVSAAMGTVGGAGVATAAATIARAGVVLLFHRHLLDCTQPGVDAQLLVALAPGCSRAGRAYTSLP